MARLFLSAPHVGPEERRMLLEALDSGWNAPLGPQVDAFEQELAALVGVPHGVALSSGTAALHLALLLLGVGPGDEVVTSTLTFAATVNAITYTGAKPVLLDSERRTYNMDPELLAEELEARGKGGGKLPKAVLVVDVYGQCADYDPLLAACARWDVPLIEDAAEALGATYKGKAAGSFGTMAAFSFNGNKIITTSGGGMLVTDRRDFAERARFLATQARDPAPHYEHSTIGYNYRLSGLLAAVGRAQLKSLAERVDRRRAIHARYEAAFRDTRGITFLPEAATGRCTRWLTVVEIEPAEFGASREDVRKHLETLDIESRPAWKPMHLQPVFAAVPRRGGEVSAQLFDRGLCLPSGSALSDAEIDRVIAAVQEVRRAR